MYGDFSFALEPLVLAALSIVADIFKVVVSCKIVEEEERYRDSQVSTVHCKRLNMFQASILQAVKCVANEAFDAGQKHNASTTSFLFFRPKFIGGNCYK